MSALTRFDPIDRMFPEMFRRFGWPTRLSDEAPAEIRIDVTERDKDYEVRAEIPGARKEDIQVRVDGNFVSIAAEFKKDTEEKSGGRVVMKETYYGSASRGFSLAHEIDSAKVVAKLEDGVLKLTLPKRQSGSGKAIEIH
jgi:HSP20 family protein